MSRFGMKIARNPNELGSILLHRSPIGWAIGVGLPVAPRRRFTLMVEQTRGALVDVRLIARWIVTMRPCECGSGVMREPRFLCCSVCSLPREPLVERARLYPGRHACDCAGPMVNTHVDGDGGHSPGCPARPARRVAA